MLAFLSTLSLRRATCYCSRRAASRWHFYPRSPCGERLHGLHLSWPECLFLSTLSLRRATIARIKVCIDNADFYPRSPCGERPSSTVIVILRKRFLSTLSLRRATDYRQCQSIRHRFLSTLSLRRATLLCRLFMPSKRISIHALLAESDNVWAFSAGFAF